MPAGSFTFDPQSQQIAFDAIAVRTYLYAGSGGAGSGGGQSGGENDSKYTLLPNVRCEQIQYKEGAEPPTARFSYILDEVAAANNGWPSQFEQLWPLAPAPPPGNNSGDQQDQPSGHYVVATDDELVVLGLMPDQTTRVLFHGYARVPQTDISAEHQSVTFVAVGVAVKCWNTPIGGRWERNGDNPNSTDQTDQIFTDLPTRFNPAGTGTRVVGGYLPNCTPDNYDITIQVGSSNPEEKFPIFLDPNIDRDPDPRTLWNLSKAVRYILAIWNDLNGGSGTSPITSPDFTVLDTLLQNRRPKQGSDWFNPNDPSTYDTDPNVIRDYDATNKPWPEVVAQLLGFYGFGMRWVCEDDDKGEPYDYLEVYRKDAAAPGDPKQLQLPTTGTKITDAQVNVGNLHAAFDYHGVANDVFVETSLKRFEVAIILAPGFKPASGDGQNNGNQFRLANIDASVVKSGTRQKYRYYIADECGDGHWSQFAQTWIEQSPIDLTSLFKDPNSTDPNPPPTYVHRYRPGKNKLFSKDLNNLPLKAQLAVSRNYGPQGGKDGPLLWDGSSGSDWRDIAHGWRLLTDRLGIMVTADNPQEWHVGQSQAGATEICTGGIFRGVSAIADPNTAPNAPIDEQPFWLRLTTVIEGDFGIGSEAKRREASPMKDIIKRRIDAKDHFHYDVIDGSSPYAQTIGKTSTIQDDTDNSLAHASQLRTAHEFPPLTAAITIPMFVTSYQVGDRIDKIAGREVSLQVNAGKEQQEAPSYPFVVAVTWDFTGEKQSTVLQLSDRRSEPQMHAIHENRD